MYIYSTNCKLKNRKFCYYMEIVLLTLVNALKKKKYSSKNLKEVKLLLFAWNSNTLDMYTYIIQ